MFGVGEIGQHFKFASGGIEKIALHAGAGCLSSVAGGGSCKSGAMSGALGEIGLNLPDGGTILNTAKAAMLGGLGSKLAGGKFADGAQTGAFGYLFNELLHSGKGAMERSGYKETKYPDGTMCNTQSGNPACGFPGSSSGTSGDAQASFTISGTTMKGFTGESTEVGYAVDTTGNVCKVSASCKIYGVGLGSAVEVNAQVSGGKVSDGWSIGLVGAGEAFVFGATATGGYGSDGPYGSLGKGRGLLGVVGIKTCTSIVSQCTK
jgi:hypothetical protein